MDWNIFEAKLGSDDITHTLVHNLKEFEEVMLESYRKHGDDPYAYLKVTTTMPRHFDHCFINDEAAYCTIFLYSSNIFSYSDFIDENGKFIKRPDFRTFIRDKKRWETYRQWDKEKRARRYKAWYEKKKTEKCMIKIKEDAVSKCNECKNKDFCSTYELALKFGDKCNVIACTKEDLKEEELDGKVCDNA